MKRYVTSEYEITVSCPPYAGRSFTLAFFTDLHNCCRPDERMEIISRIVALNPDLVLCGGDSIVAVPGTSTESAVKFLQHIAAQFPLVIGTGNHEYRTRLYPETYGSMYSAYREPLSCTDNVFLLENEQRLFRPADIPVRIYGFELPREYYRRFGKRRTVPVSELSRVFGSCDRDCVTVLLSHNPAALPACLEWGADLTLSGHYHGGIMRLGEHRGLISPEFRLFPNDVFGRFETGGKHAIISSGCGEHTLPVRLCNPREIVGIRISVTR